MSGATSSLPQGLLLTFYGDDYTGSSAVMEVLTFAGLPTVVFLNTPTAKQLAAFRGYRALGIAGIARSQSREWMNEHLPPIFHLLRELGAPIAHYKVCSTFDSAPHVGSIGHAIDLGTPILGGAWQPLVVAAPDMGRYQAFGNLFAAVGGVAFRLDRHPTMSRHPVTPMDEADVRVHLARQTDKSIGLIDFVAMKRGEADACLSRESTAGADIIALDIVDDETLTEAGRLIWEHRGERLFAIGSQGLEAALVAYFRASGRLGVSQEALRIAPVSRVVCVSGSCSPVTGRQIAFAERNGFAAIRLDAQHVVSKSAWQRELERSAVHAMSALDNGRDPLIFTAAGPDDPAVGALRSAIEASSENQEAINARLGSGLGWILDRVLRQSGVSRAVISGGDTSGYAASALGVYALTALAPVASGSPLCRAHAEDSIHDGLEIALKGGQVGAPDFFCAVKRGGSARVESAGVDTDSLNRSLS